ncbi:FAD-dependent oxidoreductase [Streptomyces sp. NPDC058319]|uniref:FAD-dependent oxidoreductase n=1 Tax=unclassified Streptomyces TaxID=2593676 RepID=UPI0036E9B3BC
MTKAVVLGGGMAGMLAASVLTRHADEVTIVEGDRLPDRPVPRRGLPQGYHSHMFMGGGALALEDLLPGVLDRLYAAGASRRGMPWNTLTLSAGGWFPRHRGDAFIVVCSRELTDHVVRQRVLESGTVEVVQSAKVVGLAGDSGRVTGVRVQDEDGERVLTADFVVDATGRRSRAPQWLAELGVPAVEEESVDPGLAYSTRLYRAPQGVHPDFPALLIQPQAGTGQPGRGATLFPIEGGRWIATMTGTRGAQPPTDEAGFDAFARGQRHTMIADLLAQAEPISEVRPYKGTVNRRRHYERLPLPEGFAVVGDAVAALNPVYAHGMSASAFGALALRGALEDTGLKPGLAAKAQSAVAEAVETPWSMAVQQDVAFPDVRIDNVVVPAPAPEEQEFMARLAATSLSEPVVANAMFGVFTLMSPASGMVTPEIQELVLRGPSRPQLTAEEAIAQFPELGGLLTPAAVR